MPPLLRGRRIAGRTLVVGLVLLGALSLAGPVLAYDAVTGERETAGALDPDGTGLPALDTQLDPALACQEDTGGPCDAAQAAETPVPAEATVENQESVGGGPLYEMAFDPALAAPEAPTAAQPQPGANPYSDFHPDGFVFLSRQAWGADEAGTRANIVQDDKWGFSQTVQKIVIHHTDTVSIDNDPSLDPATYMGKLWNSETHWHEVNGKQVKYTDLTYHYVILPNGWVAEGRSSSDGSNAGGTRYPGEDDQGHLVKGAGVPGLNGDLLHIALACDCENGQPTDAQMTALTALLVELDKHYHIDPEGTDLYKNPTTGVEAKGLHNVCAHRDFNETTKENTACPGENFYQRLDQVRADVRRLCAPECLEGAAGAPTAEPTEAEPTEPAAEPAPATAAPGKPGTRDFSCEGTIPDTLFGSWEASVPVDYEPDGRGGYIVSNVGDERADGSVAWHNIFSGYELLPGSGATAVASTDGHSVTVRAKLRIRHSTWWLGWNDAGVQEVTCSATHAVTP
jgi:hypothetical protein